METMLEINYIDELLDGFFSIIQNHRLLSAGGTLLNGKT